MHWVSNVLEVFPILVSHLLNNFECTCIVRALELEFVSNVSEEEREILKWLGWEQNMLCWIFRVLCKFSKELRCPVVCLYSKVRNDIDLSK